MRFLKFAALALSGAVLALAAPALATSVEPPKAPAAAPARAVVVGTLTAVEDGGYPMAILVMDVPDVGAGSQYSINLEEAKIEGGELGALTGQKVKLTTETTIEPSPVDIQFGGKSVFLLEGDPPAPPVEGEKSITGILSGAAEVTGGDLPDEVTVTAKDGTAVTFEIFIDDRLAAANGKEVALRYTMNDSTRVIEVAKAS